MAAVKSVVPRGKVLPDVQTDPRKTGPGRRPSSSLHSSSRFLLVGRRGPPLAGGLFERVREKSGTESEIQQEQTTVMGGDMLPTEYVTLTKDASNGLDAYVTVTLAASERRTGSGAREISGG